ncbi:MAG: hypothetical protein CL846_00495 [Crocinitomicaceae bacterium]|nr:hypothetical protein [Crocinitomicaceae bacterium]|tara:strand:- start:5639 stop:5938 length:300 start_codon:yes stop_codon:yes gene_type:complete
MKKYILILVVLGAVGAGIYLFYPQKASQETIDKMADEICSAIDGVDFNDMESLMNAAIAVAEITDKTEYQLITEDNQDLAAKEKCPDNWAKFVEAYEKM